MSFDPYKTYRAGAITASLIAAQTSLEQAAFQAVDLDMDLYEAIQGAIRNVRQLRKRDLWEMAR